MDSDDVALAKQHRSQLNGVTFVAVTGSCGKTTTKDLATGVLSRSLRGTGNPGSGNCGSDVVRHLLQVRSDHDFCIQELGAWGPGTLDAGLALVQPQVGVVLNVRRDHYGAFKGLDHTQAEKAKVVACLPAGGTAILNADDPHVAAMRAHTRARVLTFGADAGADFRVQDVRAAWPERLSFELQHGGCRRRVRTALAGEHLVGSAAAALAIAHVLGVPMEAAIESLAGIAPTPRRMSVHTLDSGAAVVRDDFKATSDSLGELLRFVDAARADRKILVVGRISDYQGRSRAVYTAFAHAAARVVDLLLFVGDRAQELWGGSDPQRVDARRKLSRGRARVELFATVRDARRFLDAELGDGDLLVLKGSGQTDHLERVALGRARCWRAKCGRVVACDECEWLEQPAEPGDPAVVEKGV